MLELARAYSLRLTHAHEIAENQGISLKYLEALLARLKSAGLVTCVRGKTGGYSLARPPEEISLFDVLRPLEDSLAVVHCTKDPSDCPRLAACVTRDVWMELRDAAERILRRTSLLELVMRQERLEAAVPRHLPMEGS